MRALPLPTDSNPDVFDDCTRGTYRPRSLRLKVIRAYVLAVDRQFGIASAASVAHLFPQSYSFSAQLKSDMIWLYEKKFRDVRRAQALWDRLLIAAPDNLCPHCGGDPPVELDHCLPKSKFPQLSVTPTNLVPICRNCNAYKLANDKGSLNPYSDHWAIDEPWLEALVDDYQNPRMMTFVVRRVSSWDVHQQRSADANFADFDLATRYRARASVEIGTRMDGLSRFFRGNGLAAVVAELRLERDNYAAIDQNCWQRAAFDALIVSAPRVFI